MSTARKYIIVDDDHFSNVLCKMQLQRTLGDVDIKTFEVPEEGLSFIKSENNKGVAATIVFLDLNMHTLTGWEFIELFEKFGEEVKKDTSIYILSSSVDPRDKSKAEGIKYIKGFISKPLNREAILSIAEA
jgi:response regulator RpfG family c-di-GMP phosphodiesterase